MATHILDNPFAPMGARVKMVNPEQGAKFAEQLARIMGAAGT